MISNLKRTLTMDNSDYRKAMIETMLVESLTNNEARFAHLLSSGFTLQEVVTVSRAMRLLIDKALEQVVQKILDVQEETPPPSPPTTGSFFDPSMN